MLTWKTAFLLTQIIEVSVGVSITRYAPKMWGSIHRMMTVIIGIVCASAITHPILWFVIHPWSLEHQWTHGTFFLVGEGYVWLTEGLWYKVLRFHRPFLFSLCLNLASFLFGLLLQQIL